MADAPPPAVDAYAMFLRARSAVTSARYPSRIDYTIVVRGVDGSVARTNRYRGSCRTASETIAVGPISEEEAAKPASAPRGFNFALTAFICGGKCETGSLHLALPVGQATPSPDVIGVPVLTPTYMFGLRTPHGVAQVVPGSAPGLPVIAVVSTKQRDYAVMLVDEPMVDGLATYHLRLTALRKPKVNRLRELWIGQRDFLPRRATVAGEFTIAPLVDVPWAVDFAVVDGAVYIARESAGETLYLAHRRVVHDASIAFEGIGDGGPISGRPLIQPTITDTTLVEP